MSEAPSAAVVIPVYNGAAYIERTVRSAAAQTFPNLDILAINDGSTDGTLAILERLADEIENFRFVTVSNGGVARARNAGTERVSATYVAYLDADDLWHPTKIEKQVAALERLKHDPSWAACYCYTRVIDVDDHVLRNFPSLCERGAFYHEHLKYNHVGNGSNVLVRRDVALEVGGFEPSYADHGIGGCEDRDFQLRILRRYKMELVKEYLVGYRVYPGNMSSNHLAMARGQIAVVESFLEDGMPAYVRNNALAGAHAYSWYRFLKGGDYANALRSFSNYIRRDPGGVASELRVRAGRLFDRLSQPAREKIGVFASGSGGHRDFYAFDPHEGVTANARY